MELQDSSGQKVLGAVAEMRSVMQQEVTTALALFCLTACVFWIFLTHTRLQHSQMTAVKASIQEMHNTRQVAAPAPSLGGEGQVAAVTGTMAALVERQESALKKEREARKAAENQLQLQRKVAKSSDAIRSGNNAEAEQVCSLNG